MKHTFEFNAGCDELLSFREELNAHLVKAGLADKQVSEVLLAVQEVLTNIIRHAYENEEDGKIEVAFEDANDRVQFKVKDYGKRFNWTTVPDPDLPKESPGGLGVYLVRQLMDEVKYDEAFEEGNLITLTKLKGKR